MGSDYLAELAIKISTEDQATSGLQAISAAVTKTAGTAETGFQAAGKSANSFGTQIQSATTQISSMMGTVDRTMNILDRYDITQMRVESSQLRLVNAQENYNKVLNDSSSTTADVEKALRQLEIAQNKNTQTNIMAQSSYVMIGASAIKAGGDILVYATSGKVVADTTALWTTLSGGLSGALIALRASVLATSASVMAFATSGTIMATVTAGLTSSFAALSAVLVANPVGASIALIVLAIVGLKIAWDNNWGGIQQKTESAVSAIMTALDKIPYAVGLVTGAYDILANATAGWGSAWDYVTGKTNASTTSLDTHKAGVITMIDGYDKLQSALFAYYTSTDKISTIENTLAQLRKDYSSATTEYNDALNKLTVDTAKQADIEGKMQILIEKGMTNTPIYNSLVNDHDKIIKDVAKDKEDLNKKEETYAKYRDKSVEDDPKYKLGIMELGKAHKEEAINKGNVNTVLNDGIDAYSKNNEAVGATADKITIVAIPAWMAMGKGFSESTDKIKDPTWSNDTNTNIGTIGTNITTNGIPKWGNYDSAFTTSTDIIKEPGWSVKTNENIGTVATAQATSVIKTGEWKDGTIKGFDDSNTGVGLALDKIYKSITDWGSDVWTYLFGASIIPDIVNGFDTWFGKLPGMIGKYWEDIKIGTSTKWSDIKTSLGTKWTEITTGAGTWLSGLKTNTDTKWGEMNTAAGTAWGNIKISISTKWGEIKSDAITKAGEVKSAADTAWSNIRAAVPGAWAGIKSALETAWSGILTAAKNMYAQVVSTWNAAQAKASIPVVVAAPVFAPTPAAQNRLAPTSSGGSSGGTNNTGSSVDGGGFGSTTTASLSSPAGRDYSWYAEGGDFIATKPQLIGVGDAPERVTITPLSKGGGGGTTVNMIFNAPIFGVNDLEKAIDAALRSVSRNIRARGG